MLTARTFTYASEDFPILKRLTIRSIERMTGRLRVWKLYREYCDEYLTSNESFWDAAIRKLQLDVNYGGVALDEIPRKGPLVVVANHPFGVLDGVVITHMMMQVRTDFKVLTNSALCRAPEANDHLLPIDFSGSEAGLKTNLETRRAARQLLKNGGCITVFPAGGVSTIPGWRAGVAQDTAWQPFIARLIHESNAAVVPVFFAGQNSRLFQWASLLSPTLRLALFMKEVIDKIGGEIDVTVGAPIPYEQIAHITDRAALCDELRRRTYALGGLDRLPPPKPAFRTPPR